MKSNEQLQMDLLDTIECESFLNAAKIEIIAKNSVVVIKGGVDDFTKKITGETSTKGVNGISAAVDKSEIAFGNYIGSQSTAEIAIEVLKGLQSNWDDPYRKVKVKVERGWGTLEGKLEWNHQKEAVTRSINNQNGVKGVTNNIIIRNGEKNKIELKDIETALCRNWSINEGDIEVQVSASKSTLKGILNSFYARNEAERISWKASDVYNVLNKLEVENAKILYL
jgi:osmotically-inducible protein OsmY